MSCCNAVVICNRLEFTRAAAEREVPAERVPVRLPLEILHPVPAVTRVTLGIMTGNSDFSIVYSKNIYIWCYYHSDTCVAMNACSSLMPSLAGI